MGKSPEMENECNKIENRLSQKENPHFTENKVKIEEMKQNIIKELTKLTNTDMKEGASFKK